MQKQIKKSTARLNSFTLLGIVVYELVTWTNIRNKLLFSCFILSLNFTIYGQSKKQIYFPGSTHEWQSKQPGEVGLSAIKIKEAVQFAIDNESDTDRNLEIHHYTRGFGREPFGFAIGPHKDRGAPTGIILRHGYIVASWGEPNRVDMTHSVSKSFLSATVGVAFDQGLIRNVNDKVDNYMAPVVILGDGLGVNKAHQIGEAKVFEPFKSLHNNKITWNHLLRQTSNWEGTLWGKPDWADRPSGDANTWITRTRKEPGSAYEYNDTRVNLLALAATNIWRKPLPQVLNEHVMDPIGATPTWRWMGYENSWILLDGVAVQVVSGGGHWGGGMFINAYDQARFGYLTLNRGKWKDKQILSEAWVKMALTPTPVKKDYGFMNWFLNTDKERLPSAPESSFFHLGAGTNMVYVDPENDIVVVARWIDRNALDGLVKRVLEAVERK